MCEVKMAHCSSRLFHFLGILAFVIVAQSLQADLREENGVKTAVFLSPKFVLEPGSVADKYFYNIDFPRGHIAVKSFNAEVVDEAGNSIPLHETYVHHWIVTRYYHRTEKLDGSDFLLVRNSGICDYGLSHYFGLGAETRKTSYDVPDPYGIEVGNPDDIPPGYEERWMVNVHAIDTRGAEDKRGCTECRCDLYNVTVDGYDQPLPPDYRGGFRCCYDQTRCRVRHGFPGVKRSLYLKYTVKYADWQPSILPVQIYILDVTDIWTRADESRGIKARHTCLIEYEVPPSTVDASNDSCIHTKSVSVSLPAGGDVVYGVAHQHAAGTGSTLFGEDGRVICSSYPMYGEGKEPGNEAGYIVGMSACYPRPGSIKISAGEMLTLVSNYSSSQRHTGVMGLFYILVADSSQSDTLVHASAEVRQEMTISLSIWGVALFGLVVVLVVMFAIRYNISKAEVYEAI